MWHTIDKAPEGVYLDTAIKTDHGFINEALLKKVNDQWYLRSGTKVLENPTHFFENEPEKLIPFQTNNENLIPMITNNNYYDNSTRSSIRDNS